MYIEIKRPPSVAEILDRLKAEREYREGRAGTAKGKLAEKRCLAAAEALCKEWDWLISARLATKQEDGRGIDLVVDSNIGLLYIQVKSSHRNARYFRRKRKRCKAIVVIVSPEMDDHKIKCKVFYALCCLRKHFSEKKRKG